MIPFSGVLARLRSLGRGLGRGSSLDADMADEMRTHMELRAADLVRSGVSPTDAARQARLEFRSVGRVPSRMHRPLAEGASDPAE